MSRRSRLTRLFVTSLVGLLLGFNFGLTPALTWMAACLAFEAWALIQQRRLERGLHKRAHRLMRLAPIVYLASVWSIMGAASWVYGSPPMKFAALVILFGLQLEALKYAATSGQAFLALAPAPFAALIIAPAVFGGFRAWDLVIIGVALFGLGIYLFDAARVVRANAQALEQARADALAADRAKSDFLAMMSHELRTPMNGVLGMAQALASTELNSQQSGYLDLIVQSGDGLMAVLNDILDLTKIEAGKLEFEVVAFDVRDLSGQLHKLWSEAAQAKGVTLTLDVDPAVPEWLAGDPTRVRQILANLVSNALKFTEAGSVAVRIAAREGDGVEITVADTGIGMTKAQQDKLFQAFTQAESSTARRFGGTGLGLSICRQLVEMMGGEISVSSRQGHGSTFRAVLPLAAAEAPQAGETASAPPRLGGRRLLVVDDNAANRTVARAILEAAGARVTLATGGREAIEHLDSGEFDVVLMDVHMPVMDGVEALRRIRAGEGGRADIPVMALTADAMSGQREKLIAEGFDDAHPKPFRPDELMRAVVRCCARPA